ncbi:hypothetical protein M9H77_08209 [Catharanthus roseus]|uniref:Uncharacterized protein n=1 Tax=Catharanthus roseus TaxID=4058 RepID=A0ACC0BXB4_CATRO|nr:hypothetical protein M9H77_08209 [Catharanthus roseus]
MDMDSEMCDIADLLDQISTGPLSKARKMHRLVKGALTTKGRWKTNSTKRDKSYWEHVSIAHRKIQKSNGSDLSSSSRSSSGPHERGRPPRAPRGTLVIGHLAEQQHFIKL